MDRGATITAAAGFAARMRLRHVLLLALVLRLGWIALVPIRPVSDAMAYDQLAQRIAAGYGYSWPNGAVTAYWPVGTPALYASLYEVFGHDMIAVAGFNVALGVALVALTFALARSCFDYPVALLAAFLTAIWPTWIAFTTIISSELPSNILFVAGTICALSTKGSAVSRMIASAALLTGAAYFRATMLPFAILVPILAAIAERKPRQILMRGVIGLIVCAALVAPWANRNLHAVGAAAPISTNFGVNLWIGNNPQATGGYLEPPLPEGTLLPQNEVARDRFYQKHAIDFIADNPERYIMLCMQRLRLVLDRETFGVAWNDLGLHARAKVPLKLVMSGYWYLILLAGIGGATIFVRQRVSNLLSPFVLLPAAAMATPVLVMATERYHYAAAPFIATFGAYAVMRWATVRANRAYAAEMPVWTRK